MVGRLFDILCIWYSMFCDYELLLVDNYLLLTVLDLCLVEHDL